MIRYIFVFFILSISLFSCDHRFAQSSRARHEMLQAYFQEEHAIEPWWDRKYFLSDTHLRHQLAHYGITVSSTYVTNLLGNPIGGREQGFSYDGSFGLDVNIDFTHAGLTGLNLYAAMAWRTGDSLTLEYLDNQFNVSQIYGSQTVRLVELYLMQKLFCDRLIIKLGRLCAGDDFLSSPLYWQYVNNAFDGNPVSIFFNIPFTAYPAATWGAYVQGLPWDWLMVKAGIFNANTKIQQNKYHGVNFTFESTNGAALITEWALLLNQGRDDFYPGNYKLGFYYLTGSRNKFSGGTKDGDPGFYALFDQTIYQPSFGRSLTPFISFIWQPEDRNLFPYFLNGGIVYQGPFESRPKDVAAFGVIWGRYSKDLEEIQKNSGIETQIAEIVLELNYAIQVNQWLCVMPDMQYIIHPKGRHSVPNAWVVGAQITIDAW